MDTKYPTDSDYPKNTAINGKKQLSIPINHCIGNIFKLIPIIKF